MKKMIALFISLMLVISVAAALADGSKTTDDVTATGGNYAVEHVWKTTTSETTKKLQKELADELSKNGNISGFFPAELKISKTAQLAELFSVKTDGATGSLKFTVTPTTVITEDSKVTVLLGITDSSDQTNWVGVKGTVNSDGEVAVTIPAETVKPMNDAKDVTVAILVDKG